MNPDLKNLMVRYFKCKAKDVYPDQSLRSLGAENWQIIEMAMEFEDRFGIPMDADKALSMKKVSDWARLIEK
jgi:acyl carrier protein